MQQQETTFGQYQLIEKIAQGGMAEIFRGKARDFQGIEKQVVIKRILPQISASPEFVEMLVDEAKIAVMLSHGNIAQIYDLGKVADDYFIVMEYVEGKTLSQIMRRLRTLGKRMPVAYAVWVCSEIAAGLDYMHRKTDDQGNPLNIIHRDISPQNIIVSTSGTLKIIDFGIAKAKTKVSTTDSGVLKGKFAYMSPEHVEGQRLDSRTDIFSLGVILHELLTGQRLFKGKNNRETIQKVQKSRVAPPSSLRENIQKELDTLVLKLLQKDRDKRYQTAEELCRDLTRYLVIHYPEFSPREIIRYLAQLFPEIAQKIAEPVVPHTPTQTEKDGEPHEETAAAQSDLIRRNLLAEEVLELPSPAETPEPSPPRTPIHWQSWMRAARLVAVILLITLLGYAGYRTFPKASRTIRPIYQKSKLKIAELKENLKNLIREEPPTGTPSPLPPPAAIPPGMVILTSDPSGATIFLNEKQTPLKTPATIEVTPGAPQRIGLSLPKYRFWEESLQVKSGETVSKTATLQANLGEIEVNSFPPKAEVYLNGRPHGRTPFRLQEISPETTYDVLVRLAGYEDWTRTIKIRGGKSEVVNATLKKMKKSRTLR